MPVHTTPCRIDLHHHVLPPQFAERTPMPVAMPDVETRLGWMADAGIRTAFTSLTPRVFMAYAENPREVTRACNEYQARLVADHPDAFGAFAVLPVPDLDGALEETSYALDVLRLDGIELFSSVGGRYLGHPLYDPLFAELDRRAAVVFVHPAHATTPRAWEINALDGIIEYGFDTTRSIVNLLHTGALDRYPGIRFIFSHAGGAAPYLGHRISMLRPGALAALQTLYYDVASAMGPCALRSLQAVARTEHVVWGTDLPFIQPDLLHEEIQMWEAYDGFTAAEQDAVEFRNAETLFPRLRRAVERS